MYVAYKTDFNSGTSGSCRWTCWRVLSYALRAPSRPVPWTVWNPIASKAASKCADPVCNTTDKVKLMRKKAVTEKERTSNYLKDIFKVEKIEKRLG